MKLPYEHQPDERVWLYRRSDDKKARYGLGNMRANCKNLLVCISATPSYAAPCLLDPTVAIIDAVARKCGHDGWIVFNLYPEQSPDWDKLSSKSAEYAAENKKVISRVLSALCEQQKGKITVWVAWGAVVEARPYLKECLKDILALLESRQEQISFKAVGVVEKNGVEHPRQPNPYRSKDARKLTAFKVFGKGGYAEQILKESENTEVL